MVNGMQILVNRSLLESEQNGVGERTGREDTARGERAVLTLYLRSAEMHPRT